MSGHVELWTKFSEVFRYFAAKLNKLSTSLEDTDHKVGAFFESQCTASHIKTRGATTFSKLGVQFLGLGYYYPSREKN